METLLIYQWKFKENPIEISIEYKRKPIGNQVEISIESIGNSVENSMKYQCKFNWNPVEIQ